MKKEYMENIPSNSYRKLLFRSILICIGGTIPAILAATALALGQVSLLRMILTDLALGVCVVFVCGGEIRGLLVARKTEKILADIYAENVGLFRWEEFDKMEMDEKVGFLLSHLTDYIRNEYESTLLTKQGELFALQAQINPHFLYNTLDSIRGQAIIDGSTEIADVIEALANLFKYNISQKENMIPLRQEIDNLIYYIKIQKYRFLDKIDLVIEIEDSDYDLLNTKIPKLTLQPIIENAIYHGLEPKLGKGTIRLHVCADGNQLHLSITDDGVGMDDETLMRIKRGLHDKSDGITKESASHGIALYNLNERIHRCFGTQYGICIYSTKLLGTRIELLFPCGNGGVHE